MSVRFVKAAWLRCLDAGGQNSRHRRRAWRRGGGAGTASMRFRGRGLREPREPSLAGSRSGAADAEKARNGRRGGAQLRIRRQRNAAPGLAREPAPLSTLSRRRPARRTVARGRRGGTPAWLEGPGGTASRAPEAGCIGEYAPPHVPVARSTGFSRPGTNRPRGVGGRGEAGSHRPAIRPSEGGGPACWLGIGAQTVAGGEPVAPVGIETGDRRGEFVPVRAPIAALPTRLENDIGASSRLPSSCKTRNPASLAFDTRRV